VGKKAQSANTRFAIVGFKTEFKDGFVLKKQQITQKSGLIKSQTTCSKGKL
jgi:hypothetical protein